MRFDPGRSEGQHTEIAKPTESEKERFRSLFTELPGAEIKPMFGNLGAFVNGNMFAGPYGSTVGLRLSEADRDELVKKQRDYTVRPRCTAHGRLRGTPDPGPAGQDPALGRTCHRQRLDHAAEDRQEPANEEELASCGAGCRVTTRSKAPTCGRTKGPAGSDAVHRTRGPSPVQ